MDMFCATRSWTYTYAVLKGYVNSFKNIFVQQSRGTYAIMQS